MSIDVTVKQKLFGNKQMPLEVILGNTLHYGYFENDSLAPGVLGEREFIAYNPEAIGRGFSVVWNPREKRHIDLRLPQPSTHRELQDFYSAVERICNYWQGKLTVDGNSVPLQVFLDGLKDMIVFNDNWLQHLIRQIRCGESDSWCLYSAMWPLEMGREEAELFAENPDAFGLWLHEKQSVDACFASPQFYNTENGIAGVFCVSDDVAYLLPETPAVPFAMTNPATGKPLECEKWRVLIGRKDAEEPLADLDYAEFISRIPAEKRQRFDSKRFLCQPFSAEELRGIVENR